MRRPSLLKRVRSVTDISAGPVHQSMDRALNYHQLQRRDNSTHPLVCGLCRRAVAGFAKIWRCALRRGT